MEIYKDLSSPENKQFEKLLNSQLSKNIIEEGKIIDGKITKITEKFVNMPEYWIFPSGRQLHEVTYMNFFKLG
mgnify:CR=1 FL=1